MVDQDIVDLPDDSGVPFDGSYFLPLEKILGDSRRRTLASLIPGFQTPVLQDVNYNNKNLHSAALITAQNLKLSRNGFVDLMTHNTGNGPTSTLFSINAHGKATGAAPAGHRYSRISTIAQNDIVGSEAARILFSAGHLGSLLDGLEIDGENKEIKILNNFNFNLNGSAIIAAGLITAKNIDLIDTVPVGIKSSRTAHSALDVLFGITMRGKSSISYPDGVVYGKILLESLDDTVDDESASLRLNVMNHGVELEGILIDGLANEVKIANDFNFNLNDNDVINAGTLNTHTIPGGTGTLALLSDVGESNTASNVGTGGIAVFKQKSGVDLQFKKLIAQTSRITLTDNVPNNVVEINVDEANLTSVEKLSNKVTSVGTPGTDTNYPSEKAVRALLDGLKIPFTWSLSDEDSILPAAPIDSLYTTEPADEDRDITDLIAGVKRAPTGSKIVIQVLRETGVNTNSFSDSIGLIEIDIGQYTSTTAIGQPNIIDGTWAKGVRLQFRLVAHDTNFAATGLKGTVKA